MEIRWKYDRNTRRGGQLREIIKWKYDGNTIETDFATLREIIKWKYGGNTIEIPAAAGSFVK